MYLLNLLSLVSLFGAALAKNIHWDTCENDYGSPIPVDCGEIEVPLDYTDSTPDAETLTIGLLRVPAKNKPAKGSILLNFGGPGQAGRPSLASKGAILQQLSGLNYNLISFDPRGTGGTIPFECYVGDEEKRAYDNDIQFVARAQDKPLLGRLWARGKITADKCAQRKAKTGAVLSTAFVARDMLQMTEALGEDGLLRYWGFSYGTTLGATLVSMFPDKIDKVILDGVQNPHEYYHAYADIEEWADSDKEFSQIFEHCTKNPDLCPLARDNLTAAQLEESAWDLIDRLDLHPITIDDHIIDRSVLNFFISSALYSTELWQNLTTTFDMLINGNEDVSFLREVFSLDGGQLEERVSSMQTILGIHCLDRAARAGTLEELTPTLDKMANISRVMDGIPGYINLQCAQWKLEPKERYNGDFNVEPRSPVLLIGNTWDGLTPVRSAHNVSAGFEGSGVLEVHGHGHTSVKLPSNCSWHAMKNYWQNGDLPKKGTVCGVDSPPFSNITWADVFAGEVNNFGGDLSDGDVRWEL